MSAHPRMAAIGVKIGVISPNRGKCNRPSLGVRADNYWGGGRGIRTPGPFGLRFSRPSQSTTLPSLQTAFSHAQNIMKAGDPQAVAAVTRPDMRTQSFAGCRR